MSDQTEFILPRAAILRAYVRVLPWVALVLAILPFVSPARGIATTLETALLVSVAFFIAYWFTKRHKWVSLSSAGIQGSNVRGAKVLIAWSEQVTLQRTSYAGIAGVAVQGAAKKDNVFLPLPIATSTEFSLKLTQVAPANHPLLSVSKEAP